MGTSFKVIYQKFLSKIDDPTFAELSDDDALEIMHEMLIAAIASVREFRDGGYALTEDKTAFLYTLSPSEKEVLALGMLECWQEAQANSITLTKHFITSKEQVFFAQHNHLNGLISLKTSTFHEKERIRSRYKTLHNDYLGTDEELDEEEDYENPPDSEDEEEAMGIYDYNKLKNKPKLNDVTLQGDVTISGAMNEDPETGEQGVTITVEGDPEYINDEG